jgi:hypothetical protein
LTAMTTPVTRMAAIISQTRRAKKTFMCGTI